MSRPPGTREPERAGRAAARRAGTARRAVSRVPGAHLPRGRHLPGAREEGAARWGGCRAGCASWAPSPSAPTCAACRRTGRARAADRGDLHARDALLPRAAALRRSSSESCCPGGARRAPRTRARGGCGCGARRARPARSPSRWRWCCARHLPARGGLGASRSSPRTCPRACWTGPAGCSGPWSKAAGDSRRLPQALHAARHGQPGRVDEGWPGAAPAGALPAAQPQRASRYPGLGRFDLDLLPQRPHLLRCRARSARHRAGCWAT